MTRRATRRDPDDAPESALRGWLAAGIVVLLIGAPLGLDSLGAVARSGDLPPSGADASTTEVTPSDRRPSALPQAAAPSRDPTAVVRAIPDSIDSTGAADVTGELQAFLDSVPDGAIVEFAAGGRYRIEGTLRIIRRQGLVLDGRGATFFATRQTIDPERAHWSVESSTNIWIHSMTVRGAHPEPGTYVEGFEWQHAIQIRGGSDIEIGPNVATTENQGDGVYVADWADGVYIHDCTITWNGRMGVAVVAGQNVLVERCTLNNIAFSVFDIEPNPGNTPAEGAQGITFRGNLINGAVFSKFFAMGGYGAITDVVVSQNVVDGASNGIAVDGRPLPGTPRRSNVSITDNIGEGVLRDVDAVMHFSRIDGLTVSGNRQEVAPGGIVFATGDDWNDVVITDNDCPGCAG